MQHSFLAAPSEGQGMSAAFTRGWLQSVKVGVQPGVPRAVLLSRVLAARGLCAGAGTLPLVRVSTQPPWGSLTAEWGKAVGGNTTCIRSGSFC